MTRRWIGVGALLSCFGIGACADLLGFKTLEESDAAATDSGGGDVVNQPDVDSCNHLRWPGESDATAPVADASTYIVALKDIFFSTAPDGGTPTFGYDLDDRCTTTDPSTASCTAQTIIQDGLGGIDNTSIQIMSTFVNKFSFAASTLSDTAINQNIANGSFSLVLHVYGYGGGLNQSRTTGLSVAVQGAVSLVGTPPAKFDGTDEWVVDVEDSIPSTNTPKNAYPADVVNGVLVTTFNNAPVTLHVLLPPGSVTGVLTVTLEEPVVTGVLSKRSDGQYDLTSGVIGGRWKASDILKTLAGLDVFGAPLCTYLDGGAQSYAAQSVCPYLDITSSGTDNNTEPCDAISVALGFSAVSASIATNPASFTAPSTPCPFDAGGCN